MASTKALAQGAQSTSMPEQANAFTPFQFVEPCGGRGGLAVLLGKQGLVRVVEHIEGRAGSGGGNQALCDGGVDEPLGNFSGTAVTRTERADWQELHLGGGAVPELRARRDCCRGCTSWGWAVGALCNAAMVAARVGLNQSDRC